MLDKISKPMNDIFYPVKFLLRKTCEVHLPNKLNSTNYKTQSKICKRVSFQIIMNLNYIKTHQIRNIST